MAQNSQNRTIRDTRFIFRTNFRGEETQFNKNGNKEFNILLPDDLAEEMAAEGWNVKYTKPREEGDIPEAFLPVRVNFKSNFPPRVWLINADTGNRTMLDDDTIGQLDYLARDEISKVNVVVNPSRWESPQFGSGIKAYCQSMQVYFLPDPFEAEYEAKYGAQQSGTEEDVPF